MAVVEIDGLGRVEIDGFRDMPPDQQAQIVDEILATERPQEAPAARPEPPVKDETGLPQMQGAEGWPSRPEPAQAPQKGMHPAERDPEPMGVAEATGTALGNVPERWQQAGAGLRRGRAEAQIGALEDVAERFDSSFFRAPRYRADVAKAFDQFAAENELIDPSLTGADRYTALARAADKLTPEQRQAFKAHLTATEQGRAETAAEDYRAAGEAMEPVDVEPGSAAYYVSGIVGSLAEMGPGFAASLATGNPAPAMAFIGALVGGQSYAEGREEGLPPDIARNRAILMSAAEGIPPVLPLSVILKPGSRFFRRLAESGAAEGAQEAVTESLQILIDKGYLEPDTTWGEAKSRILDASIMGAGAGGAMATAAHGAQAAGGKARTFLPKPNVGKEAGREMQRQTREPSMAERIDAYLWEQGIDPRPQTAPPQELAAAQEPFELDTYISKLTGVESGGDAGARNPRSSAGGLGQFLDSTWVETVKKHAPEVARTKTRAEILAMKTDTSPEGVAFQQKMLEAFAGDTASQVQRAGFDVTYPNAYIFHFFGEGGGPKVLRADPETPIAELFPKDGDGDGIPDIIEANPHLDGMTAGDAVAWAEEKMGGEGGGVIPTAPAAPSEEETAAQEAYEQKRAEVEAEGGDREGDLFGLYMDYVRNPEDAEARHAIERLEAEGVLGGRFVEEPDFKETFPLPAPEARAAEFGEAESLDAAYENVRARFEDDAGAIKAALSEFEKARTEPDLAAMREARDRIADIRSGIADAYGPDRAASFLEAHGVRPNALDARLRRAAEVREQKEREERRPKHTRPVSLARFLAERGGLRDEGGELTQIGADEWHRLPRPKGEVGFRPRLVTEQGMDLDTAAQAVFEMGYIPERDIRLLIDAIDADIRGNRVVKQEDIAREQEFAEAEDRQNRIDEARGKVEQALAEDWGDVGLARKEIDFIAEQVADGVDVDMAIERWLVEEAENVERREDEAGDDIPGFQAEAAEDPVSGGDEEAGADRGEVGAGEARGEDDRRETAEDRGVEEPGAEGLPQAVIPGAERVTDRELAEKRMGFAKRATRDQKAPGEDGGLFDEGERRQQDMFAKGGGSSAMPLPADATSDLGMWSPQPGYQPMYRAMPSIPRPTNDLVAIGERTVKLRPMDRPTRREGIRILLQDLIGPRVYQGKVKGKARAGFYRHENAEVRIKDFDDVEVMAHEMAHWLDFYAPNNAAFTDFRKGKTATDPNLGEKIKRQVEQFSYTSVPKNVNHEGFAEFVRLWLTRYNTVREMAPDAVAEFERILARRGKLRRKMERLQDEMHRWFYQGDLARARAKIGKRLTPQQATMEFIQRAPLVRARTQLIDRFHGIKRAEVAIHGDQIEGMRSASKQFQLLGGVEGVYEAVLRFGTPMLMLDGGLAYRGKALNDIVWPVARQGAKAFDDWLQYLAARRARELKAQGRENLFTEAEITAGLRLGDDRPEFAAAAEDIYRFNDEMLDFYVEMGLLTAEQRTAFREANTNYVPFHRVIERLENPGSTGAGGIGARLTGGDRNVADIAANITNGLFYNLRAAFIARAKRTLYSDIMTSEEGALFAARIEPDSKKVRLHVEEMAKKVAQIMAAEGLTVADNGAIVAGSIDADSIVDVADIEARLTAEPDLLEFWLHGQRPRTRETYVDSAIIGGKRVWFEVRDPALVDSLTHLGGLHVSAWVRATLLSTDMIRRTVTTMPPFILGNAYRDTLSGFVLSRAGVKPVIGTLRGMTEALFKTQNFKDFMLNGGAYGTRQLAQSDEVRARRQLDADRRNASHVLMRFFANWDHVLSASEVGTRLEEFRLSRKKGADTIESAWRGREITTDFSKRGANSAVALIIRSVPFMNPAVQGIDKFMRANLEHRGKMTPLNVARFNRYKARVYAMGSIIAGFSFAIWLWNNSDDERRERYRALTDYERSRYWWIFGGEVEIGPGLTITVPDMRLPKPFEVGAQFATFPEAMMDYLGREAFMDPEDKGDDKEQERRRRLAAEQARSLLAYTAANEFLAGGYPGPLQGWVRSKANETFSGAPIIPEYLKNAPPEMQFRLSTPLIYRGYADSWLGRMVGASPLKTQFYLRTYGTYATRMAEDISEAVLWDADRHGERPFARSASDQLLYHFKVRDVPYRTRWTEGYYELRRRADGMRAGVRQLRADAARDQKPLERAFESGLNQTLLRLDREFAKIDRELSGISEAVSAIKHDKGLSAAEKERQIEGIYAAKNKLLSQFYLAAEQAIHEAEQNMAGK